jgi:hypothetical protein
MSRGLTRSDIVKGSEDAKLNIKALRSQAKKADPDTSHVVVIRDKNVIDNRHRVNELKLKEMVDLALTSLTNADTPQAAWKRLFTPQDIVGLVPTPHLNPTHKELVDIVRDALMNIGIKENRILMAQGGPEKVKACTSLVAMPALKAHWLTGIGTVLKNYIMYSGEPSKYHHQDSAKLGEIWKMPHVKNKTKLILVDALYPLCDKGPQPDPRYKWFYKGIIAGIDPVAVDTVGVAILTRKRAELKGEPWPLSPPPLCVEEADKTYHLGTSNPEKIYLESLGWQENVLI